MKIIPLTKCKSAIVDDEDYEYLSQFKWYLSNGGYAVRSSSIRLSSTIKGTRIYMHREIANTPKGKDTDHINQIRLDNRRVNLRNCSKSQNQMNVGLSKRNKSGLKGVSFHKGAKKYQAFIVHNRESIYLGLFENPKDAHAAYCSEAKKLFGEFACTK